MTPSIAEKKRFSFLTLVRARLLLLRMRALTAERRVVRATTASGRRFDRQHTFKEEYHGAVEQYATHHRESRVLTAALTKAKMADVIPLAGTEVSSRRGRAGKGGGGAASSRASKRESQRDSTRDSQRDGDAASRPSSARLLGRGRSKASVAPAP